MLAVWVLVTSSAFPSVWWPEGHQASHQPHWTVPGYDYGSQRGPGRPLTACPQPGYIGEVGLRVLGGLRVLHGSWPQSQRTVMDRFDLLVQLQPMHICFDFKNCHRFGVCGRYFLWYIYICIFIYIHIRMHRANRDFYFASLFEILHKIWGLHTQGCMITKI